MTKMLLHNQNKSRLYTLLLFLLTLIVSALILTAFHDKWDEERVNELELLLDGQGRSIEADIKRSLSGATVLAAWVTTNNGDIKQFDYFANQTVESLGGITNLQLAPDGIVKHIAPLKGHEAAIGHNILKDDKRRKEALLAIASDQMTLAGPFELVQGGIAIIGRKPVFLDKTDPITGAIDPNERFFWGYASALIYLDDILSNTKLTSLLEQGFYFQIWRYHPDTGEKQIFAMNSSSEISESSDFTIKLPNTIWHLNIEPIFDIDHNKGLVMMALLLLLIDIMLCYLIYQRFNFTSKAGAKIQRQISNYRKVISKQNSHIKELQSIIDGSSEAILICDINGYIKYVNQQFIVQSGYSSEDIIGRTPNLFRSNKTPQTVHKQLWHKILSGNVWQGNICNRHKNGELYWIDVKITPMTDDNDNIVEFVAVSIQVQPTEEQVEAAS